MTTYVHTMRAEDFLARKVEPGSVDLVLIDPPYFGIVKDTWDNQWTTSAEYGAWLADIFWQIDPLLKPAASVLVFSAVGDHGHCPVLWVRSAGCRFWTMRNWITIAKRRAYGKSHDYLHCREELLWFSKSAARTDVTFNIPYTAQLRGYEGWNKKYPAKSAYKRVTNVWSDLPELMRPKRTAQKADGWIERAVATHSNPGDLVLDCFAGYGQTGIVALKMNRRFIGCEAIPIDAALANERCIAAVS